MTILRMISAIVAAAFAMVLQAGFADAAIKTQYVDYKDGGAPLKGYLAYDDSKTGKRPASPCRSVSSNLAMPSSNQAGSLDG